MPSRRTTRKAGTRRNQLIILGLLAVGLALTIFQVQRIQIDRSRADEDISRIKEYPYPGEVASESGTLVVRSSLDRLRITVDDKEGETNHKKKIKMFRVPFKMTVPVGDHIMRAAQEKYVAA